MTIQPVGPGIAQAYNSLEYQQLMQNAGVLGVFGQNPVADTLIYLGPEYERPAMPGRRGSPGRPAESGMVTVDRAKGAYVTLSAEQKDRFDSAIERLTGERPYGTSGLYQWEQMIGNSAVISEALGRPVSVFETAELLANQSPAKPDGGRGPTTTISTTETIDLSNPSEARRLLDSTLGSYLGRLPSEREYKNFLSVLNAAEEAAPSITEQVSRTVPGEGTSRVRSKVRGEGGLSREQIATEYVRGQEDYAETRLSNTGLSAFLELLR